MDTELRSLFPTFDIVDCSNLNIDAIISIVKNCHNTQFVYLHRNDVCLQYFRIVEKVYNDKKIHLIIINGETIYYYPLINDLDETSYFKFIANNVMERMNKTINSDGV